MFSFKRLTQEFHSTLLLNSRRHSTLILIFTLWIILKHFLFFKIGTYGSNPSELMEPTFLFMIMCIATSVDVFSKLRGSISGSHYLTTPSSTSEKFVSAWLYSTVFTFLTVTVLYNLTHLICMATGNAINHTDYAVQAQSIGELWGILKPVIFFQSVYFLGSVYFRKSPVGKTTAALFGTLIIGGIIGSFIVKQYLEGLSMHGSYTFNFQNSNDWEKLFEGQNIPQVLENLASILKGLLYATPFACWAGSYFILKNKQV
jgi:hypothetical protein